MEEIVKFTDESTIEKKYNKIEVEAKVAEALAETINPLYDLLRPFIDGLITERLIAFRQGIPSISHTPVEPFAKGIPYCSLQGQSQ